jgi:hypothetical protein
MANTKPPAKRIACKVILDFLRDDEDFRWEFASNGIDSSYVMTKLGLKGKPHSPAPKDRELATEELEAVAWAIQEIVQGHCAPDQGGLTRLRPL